MVQLRNEHLAGRKSSGCTQRIVDRSEVAWQTAQRLTGAGASAVSLPGGLQTMRRATLQPGNVLVPLQDATRTLEGARALAGGMANGVVLIACTHARDARYLTGDEDPRDSRYTTGVRTMVGLHVYCGGVDASIRRGLAYAAHADVVCYYSSRLDLCEASRFSSAIRASYPHRKLGVGFSAASHDNQGRLHSESSHGDLRRLGYDYRFFTHRGSVVFSEFPEDAPWAFFDDVADTAGLYGAGEGHGSLGLISRVQEHTLVECSGVRD